MEKKIYVVIVTILFLCLSIAPSISGNSNEPKLDENIDLLSSSNPELALVTCYTYGLPGEQIQKKSTISETEVEILLNKIKELQIEIAIDSTSEKTQSLQNELFILADEHDLLPQGITLEMLQEQIPPALAFQPFPDGNKPIVPFNRASRFFCNFASIGSGSALPVIIFPRLIPIILTPIPRVFMRWSAYEGVTSCGGMLSGTGFIASGQQTGFSLGFLGIGFSIFLPPFMEYALFGYALFASVNAENIELWPPNLPPEISAITPLNGAQNVPISTSEIRFHINDFNQDIMSYSVTTDPPIGYGSGENKPDGTYSIPINDLGGSEEYIWHVQVSDGENIVDNSFIFTTEAVAPVVSDPSPPNDAVKIPINLSKLSFHLQDLQGDLMDYTVETLPDIGSDSATDVGDGMYTIDVTGLEYISEYTWFINATDGMYWKHKTFNFKTRPGPGPWWNNDWTCRKEIIIDPLKIEDNLNNFPLLIKIESDNDLASNTQDDGDDIVFTDYFGTKLKHEIEFYNPENGSLIAWINIPNLTPESILYMYYNNPISNNQQNVEETWDLNYMMVHHMNGVDALSCDDSTINGNDITNSGGTPNYQQIGEIGYSVEFEDSNGEYLSVPSSQSLEIDKDITISLWFNPQKDIGPPEGMGICSKWDTGGKRAYTLYTHMSDLNLLAGAISEKGEFITGERSKSKTTENKITPYTWQHIVMTFSPDTQKVELYKNGENVVYKYEYNDANKIYTSDVAFLIGAHLDNGIPYRFIDGLVDEVRISNIIRDDSWIKTEYNNQNYPSTFIELGPEESGP